jgi:hypothetical protein
MRGFMFHENTRRLILNVIGETKWHRLHENMAISKMRSRRIARLIRNGLKSRECEYTIIRFGDAKEEYLSGYYDICGSDEDDSMILSMQLPGEDKVTTAHGSASVGYFLMDQPKTFHPVGNTSLWCWQLGSRLQWYPGEDKGKSRKIAYNKLVDGRYGCVIQDIKSRRMESQMKRPLYSVTVDGKYGLSLNFSRLGRLRPGYGYSNSPDHTIGELAPRDDGIWRIHIDTGEEVLLFSASDMVAFEPLEGMDKAEHYFNHISINPDGSRFLFLHVWLREGKRYTRLITCNMDGGEPYALVNEGHVSHYTWKNSEEILCFSTHADTGSRYHLYKDKTALREIIGDGLLNEDGHPSYSPDGRSILTDTLPDKYSERHLLLYDVDEQTLLDVGVFFSPYSRYRGETKCDLHPRWSHSGKYIIFESAHEGKRAVYALELR